MTNNLQTVIQKSHALANTAARPANGRATYTPKIRPTPICFQLLANSQTSILDTSTAKSAQPRISAAPAAVRVIKSVTPPDRNRTPQAYTTAFNDQSADAGLASPVDSTFESLSDLDVLVVPARGLRAGGWADLAPAHNLGMHYASCWEKSKPGTRYKVDSFYEGR